MRATFEGAPPPREHLRVTRLMFEITSPSFINPTQAANIALRILIEPVYINPTEIYYSQVCILYMSHMYKCVLHIYICSTYRYLVKYINLVLIYIYLGNSSQIDKSGPSLYIWLRYINWINIYKYDPDIIRYLAKSVSYLYTRQRYINVSFVCVFGTFGTP